MKVYLIEVKRIEYTTGGIAHVITIGIITRQENLNLGLLIST